MRARSLLVEQQAEAVRAACEAVDKVQAEVTALEARLAPLRGTMSIGAIAGVAMREEAAQSEMVKRLRTRLMSHD